MSAVLVNHDQTYVKGYLPAQNYQAALESAVLEWLEGSRISTSWSVAVP